MSSLAPSTSDCGRLIAHRGASRVAPENTLAAFREARRLGAHWIEFDTMLIGDGTPVVHHDATLERCTDASGALADLTAADLAGIDAGARWGDSYPAERIPTLEEVLDLIEATGMSANLEMKCHDSPPGKLAKAVAAALARRAFSDRRIIVSSFQHDALDALRRLRPAQPLALLYDRLEDTWAETAGRIGAAALHVEFTALSAAMIRDIRAEGLAVRIFTLNQPALAVPLREAGLSGVITDHPPLYLDDPEWNAWVNAATGDAPQPIWTTSERNR